jgi:hypothetical protein
MFVSNFPYFLAHADEIRQIWLNKSEEIYHEHPETDLHIHMISTIASADEVYQNQIGPYHHQDQLWFWTPLTQQGHHHLNSFLAGFQQGAKHLKESMSLEFLGPECEEYLRIFGHHFPHIPQKIVSNSPDKTPVVILHFKAGGLNSRKAMISPYLPQLIA